MESTGKTARGQEKRPSVPQSLLNKLIRYGWYSVATLKLLSYVLEYSEPGSILYIRNDSLLSVCNAAVKFILIVLLLLYAGLWYVQHRKGK